MIGAGELVVIAMIGLLLVLSLGVVAGLVAWGRWVARRQGGGAWSGLAWLPLVALGVQVVGGCVTSALMVRAFSSVDASPPESRATTLASSIEGVTTASAILGGLGIALFALSIAVFAFGTLRAPAAGARPETRAREP